MIAYTNTKPFVYGLAHSPAMAEQARIAYDSPAECAEKMMTGSADMGIMPVAALPSLQRTSLASNKSWKDLIVSDYCIGCDGAVGSVFVFSNKPIDQVSLIHEDKESRTSNALAKILVRDLWKTQAGFTSFDDPQPAEALVLIGDRTFQKSKDYPYAYDLGEEWKKMTDLPFVFAVWVAVKKLNSRFLSDFNEAIAYGVAHRKELLQTVADIPGFDVQDYLLNKLSYSLDADKWKGLQLFMKLVGQH